MPTYVTNTWNYHPSSSQNPYVIMFAPNSFNSTCNIFFLQISLLAFPIPPEHIAAINRAVGILPPASIAAVFTTSLLFETGSPSLPTTSSPEGIQTFGGNAAAAHNLMGNDDIFVEYERLRASVRHAIITTTPDTAPSTATFQSPAASDRYNVNASRFVDVHVPRMEPGDPATRRRGDNDEDEEDEESDRCSTRGAGLVVTAMPHASGLQQEQSTHYNHDVDKSQLDNLKSESMSGHPTIDKANQHEGDVSRELVDSTLETEADDVSKRGGAFDRRSLGEESERGIPPPSSLDLKWPPSRVSKLSPLPLLVFDVQTFWALGELDEQFMFQGGIADWIDRTSPWNTESEESDTVGGVWDNIAKHRYQCCCQRQAMSQEMADESPVRSASCRVRGARHIEVKEWGHQYIRHWNGETQHGVIDQTGGAEKDAEYLGRRARYSPTVHGENEKSDPWTAIPPGGSLENLVKADVDLYFLRWLLLPRDDRRIIGEGTSLCRAEAMSSFECLNAKER